EPELVEEKTARVGVHAQGLRLTPGPVQREHPLRAQPLSQRMRRRERLELRHEPVVTAERELRVDALLGREQSQLVESLDLDAERRLVREVGERGPAPERERLTQALERALGVAFGVRATALLEQSLEPRHVDLAAFCPERVAAGPRLHALATQRL